MTDRSGTFNIMKLVKIVSLSLLFVVIVCFVAATLRTLTFDVNSGLQLAHWEKTNNIASDINQHQRKELLANFREAIQIPTVSTAKTQLNITALGEFDSLLRRVFPTVFSSHLVQHEVVANYSHLFWVPGSDLALVPYMLLAHIDVVPADENDGWEVPPFSAKDIDGFIYGRGTIDNKQSVMGILQALEYLLIRGYSPQRGFFIGLGHDEEVGGLQGAMNIVRMLKMEGLRSLLIETPFIHDILKLNVQPSDSDYAVDIRNPAVNWINNLETDSRYGSWPYSVQELLRPTFPGVIRQIRKNFHNLVVILDPTHESSAELLNVAEMFYSNNIPLRIGLVFVVSDVDEIDGIDVPSIDARRPHPDL